MDEIVLVHVLQTTNHLVAQHAHCLQSELARAELEEVL